MRAFLSLGFAGLIAVSSAAANSPSEEIRTFGNFNNINPSQLAGGEIISERGATMKFGGGITTQMCYVVMAPADKTSRALLGWDASNHENLGVFQHSNLHFPVREEDFSALNLALEKRPVRQLREETFAIHEDKSDFNLSRAEAKSLNEILRGGGKARDPQTASAAWKKTLFQRANDFQQGGVARTSDYEMGGASVKPAGQFTSLLEEQPRILAEFKPVLEETSLLGSGNPGNYGRFYWDLFDADSSGTISLGAAFLKQLGDKYQVADLEYYVTGSYYVSLTLYDIWPVTINGKPASLVWRGDFFAAPSVSSSHGIERMAYGMVMIQETKKAVRAFQQDMSKGN